MATVLEKLKSDLKEAMKAKDKVKLETIRQVMSAAQYEAMEKKVEELDDAGYLTVIQREVKKRQESIDFAKQGNRSEMIAPLEAETVVLKSYLPQMVTASEIEKEIVALKAATPGIAMGLVMKALKDKFGNSLDGKAASEVCKRVL